MTPVAVHWIDSAGPTSSWELLEDRQPDHAARCVTYGVIVSEDAEQISIAQNTATIEGKDSNQVCGVMTIPKCAVLCIVDLVEKDA